MLLALIVGLTLGGLVGWWLGQRRTSPGSSRADAPVVMATAPKAAGGEKVALAFQRGLALAQYQAGFLANTSHELRSPFNQIISLHQLILEDLCEGPEEERLFLSQAQDAIMKILKNLDLLISVSKLEVGRVEPDMQPFVVADVFTQVKMLMEMSAANRSCRLTVAELDPDLYGYGDPQWLQMVLLLLGEGAIASGTSQMHLSTQPVDGPILSIVLKHDGSPKTWQSDNAQNVSFEPEIASANAPLKGFSLPFRWQLAAQILNQIGGQLSLSAASPETNRGDTENSDSTEIKISLQHSIDAKWQ